MNSESEQRPISDLRHGSGRHARLAPLKAVLWLLLTVSAAANAVASFTETGAAVYVVLALVSMVCVGLLVTLSVRSRS